MLTLEERIAHSKEKTRQLEIQKKIKDKREHEAKRKLDMRRHTFIGKLVEEHFPAISQFQPQRTEAENRTEYEMLDTILSLLAEDIEYISRLVEKANASLQQQS